MVIIQLLLFNQ